MVTHYQNGDDIPTGYSDYAWSYDLLEPSNGAYSILDEVYSETYGIHSTKTTKL